MSSSDASSKSNSTANVLAKNIIAGTVAGWAQVIVGQPFDTIKVRMQTLDSTKPAYRGPIDCMRQLVRYEGLGGFYKGTTIPLIGIGACVSVQFVAYAQAKELFDYQNRKAIKDSVNPSLPPPPLSLLQITMAGMISGYANTSVSTIIEHIRIRQQVQAGHSPNPFKLMGQIVKEHGFLQLWKGWHATVHRDLFGLGLYFLIYEGLLLRLATSKAKKINDISSATLISCGALSGLGMWLICYPLDVVKSKIQADSMDIKTAKFKSVINCWSKTFRMEGIRGFYKGFAPCLLRSAPVNGATFLAYELAIRVMGGREI